MYKNRARSPFIALFIAAMPIIGAASMAVTLPGCGQVEEGGDEVAARAAALTSSCTVEGSYSTDWLWAGGDDFAFASLSWKGISQGATGSMTVTARLEGYSYSPFDTMAATGVIKVNGRSCGTVSFIDHTAPAGASPTLTCTVAVNQSVRNYTITIADSAPGARWEFIRGAVNNSFSRLVSVDQSYAKTLCP